MPEQSGIAKRKNYSVVEAARAMLEEKSMPKFYWAEAVRTAVYIQNRIGEKVSAHEMYFGRKPNLRHLRVFGSITYVHVPKEKQRKLDAKAEKCILVSYSDEKKGYKYYNPRTKQAWVCRDVVFDETTSWYLPSSPTPGHFIRNSEDDISEAERPPDEEEYGTPKKTLISFRLSGPNERLSRNDLSDEESASIEDSAMQSPRMKSRRPPTHKEKGEKKNVEIQYQCGHTGSKQI